jgi:hypothetical protein
MIAIIGYFLKRIINVLDNFDQTLRKFSEDYSTTKERITNMQSNCKEKHDVINLRLNDHSKRLDILDIGLGKLEVTVYKRK